jgi:hypothetical protein
MRSLFQGAHRKLRIFGGVRCETEPVDHFFILTQSPLATENMSRFWGSSMPRVLLITVLLTAQLISWNASPLFLCFDSDGEVCIDLGPGSCSCCRHEHDAADDPGRPEQSPERRPEQSPERGIGGSPCECTHLQITVPWTAVTVSSDGTHLARLSTLTPFVADDEIGRSLTPALHDFTLTVNRDVHCGDGGARTAILRC